MAIPFTEDGSNDLAKRLIRDLKAAYLTCKRAQTENAVDTYNTIVDIPHINKMLQDTVALVQGSGQVSRIISQLNELLPSDVTVTDVQNFSAAFNSLASDIEANDNLFIMSINSTTKRTEFVTPVAQGVKDTIDSRINAVLAEVI